MKQSISIFSPRFPSIAAAIGVISFISGSPAFAETVLVNPADMGAWTFETAAADGAGELVPGPDAPPLGVGSARLFTGSSGDSSTVLRNGGFSGTALADLTSLGYSSFATSPTDGRVPVLAIDVDLDGNDTVDDTLFFDPAYQNAADGNPALPDQGAPATEVWQMWNALAGGWWSLNGVAAATPGAGVKSLAEYLAVSPGATIVNPVTGGGVRVGFGPGLDSDVFDGNVDGFWIGTGDPETTYDFEPAPPDTDGDGIADEQDQCPSSDLTHSTVVIGACDSGVLNAFMPSGCNMTDLVAQCQANARNHGKFVSCVSRLMNGFKKAKVITGAHKGQVQRCAAHSKSTPVAKSKKPKKNR